jgi:hypothetical protein
VGEQRRLRNTVAGFETSRSLRISLPVSMGALLRTDWDENRSVAGDEVVVTVEQLRPFACLTGNAAL